MNLVTPVAFRIPPAELMIYARTVSDDDLCAWCSNLWYVPGGDSVCGQNSGTFWPGIQDVDGYIQHCPDLVVAQENEAP